PGPDLRRVPFRSIESLINVVSWGYYLQPLIVLGAILFICLSLAAVMRLLQIVVVEMIQRRQFVRFVGDLSHRFARVRQGALANEFPRELANRLFDIMTIQKATATLLIDGIGLILTTTLGLLLLAFYHPYLLGFDIVLFIAMVAVTRVLGWGGVRTAIDESIAKYRVVHWLQDVIASPSAFRIGGGEFLAVQRANELTMDYLQARSRQFRVLLRQIMFALTLQIFASTAVLALGGYLVMIQQLTLGQLVASEFVVTVVVGAFAKAGKSLEKFYDMMAGIDKVGHLVDLPTVHHGQSNEISGGPLPVRWDELLFEHSEHRCTVPATHVQPGQIVAVISDHVDDRADLAAALVGLQSPKRGLITIEGNSPENCVIDGGGQWIGYVSQPQIFHGTVRENISLGRGGVGQNRISQTMAMLGLDSVVLRLPDGIDTM
ncbi:MAG: ABC transporter ATP-binding protein, partial [Planctomycetota bacterium]